MVYIVKCDSVEVSVSKIFITQCKIKPEDYSNKTCPQTKPQNCSDFSQTKLELVSSIGSRHFWHKMGKP